MNLTFNHQTHFLKAWDCSVVLSEVEWGQWFWTMFSFTFVYSVHQKIIYKGAGLSISVCGGWHPLGEHRVQTNHHWESADPVCAAWRLQWKAVAMESWTRSTRPSSIWRRKKGWKWTCCFAVETSKQCEMKETWSAWLYQPSTERCRPFTSQ